MSIIISKDGDKAKKISESRFANEDKLQNYIYDNPESIPLYEIDEDIKLLILAREVPTQSGPIDAIGIDIKGNVYIIETKLYKNPDKRLVVAQVLDYGAAISENADKTENLLDSINKKVNSYFNLTLNDKLSDFYNINIDSAESIIDSFENNILNGKLRFVVLMDLLQKRLKDLISFINRNSKFDIYGVELKYYQFDNFEITIPKIYGAEIKKEVSTKSAISNRKTWDEQSFFSELSLNVSNNHFETIKSLYNSIVDNDLNIKWGTGSVRGSFNPVIREVDAKSLFTIYTDGVLQLNYAWFIDSDFLLEFKAKYLRLLSEIFDLSDDIEKTKYPKYQLSDWIDKNEKIDFIIKKLLST